MQKSINSQRPGCLKIGFIILGVVFVLGMIGAIFSDKKSKSNNSNSADKTEATTSHPEETKVNWKYETTTDKMDNSTSVYATTESTNELDFEFPYGKSSFTLTLRKNSKGTDVILQGTKCQFITGIMGDKEYRIKFDNNSPMSVEADSPSDGDAKTVFLGSPKKIINQLKSAKTLTIEAEFYQEGFKTIDFNVGDLNW